MNINNNILNTILYNNLSKNINNTNTLFENECIENINEYVSNHNTKIQLNSDAEIKLLLSNNNQMPTEENINLVKVLVQNSLPLTKENIQNIIKATKMFTDLPIEKALFLIQNDINPTLTICNQLEDYISKKININTQLDSLFSNIENLENNQEIFKNILKNTSVQELISNTNETIKDIKSSLFNTIINCKDDSSNTINFLIEKSLNVLNLNKTSIQDMFNNTNNTQNKSDVLNKILDFLFDDTIMFENNKLETFKQLINVDSNTYEHLDFNYENKSSLLKDINNFFDKDTLLIIQKKIFDIIKSNPDYVLKVKDFANKCDIIQNKFRYFNIEDSSPEDLNEFFNDIDNILKNLKDSSYSIKDNNEILKNLDNINRNFEFMSNLKDSTFLQIPLNINNFSTTAELFVFSNKKNKNSNKKNNSGSALISLNLLYLGKLEIYINKENKDINCQFRLEKEETKNIVKKNIDLLKYYLNQKNLSLKDISFKDLNESFTLIDENINNIKSKSNENISISSFNAKA